MIRRLVLNKLAIHENATEFDGFRFARERAEHGATQDPSQDIFKHQMISTGPDHLAFGTGKHACPVSLGSHLSNLCN
jgi:cytochrome P450